MKKKFLNDYSITRQLTVYLTFAVTFISLLALAISLFNTIRNSKNDLNSKADSTISEFSQILEIPLWNVDKDTIKLIGESISGDKDIIKVNIYGSEDALIYSFFNDSLYKNSKNINRSKAVLHNKEMIGSVEIAYTYKNIQRNIKLISLYTLIITVIIIITIIVSIRVIISIILIKPFRFLTQTANLYTAKNYNFEESNVRIIEFKPFEQVLNQLGRNNFIQLEKLQKVHNALSENEEKFRLLFENANDAIFIMKDNVFINCNDKTMQLFGCTREEIINRTPYTFSPVFQPDGRLSEEKALEYIDKALNGAPQQFEWRHYRTDKSLFDAEVSLNMIELKNEVLLLAIVRDVSERKKAEDIIKDKERRIRGLFDLAFEFIGLLDPEGVLLDANLTALEFAGAKPQDVLGKPFWETPWWSHSIDMQQKMKDAIHDAAEGKTVRFEASHPDSKGVLHIIDFSLKPVNDENGKIVFLIPEGRDITDRKIAEETLQEQSHFQELLMNISMKYINLPLEEVDKAISVSLREMAEFVGADRANIFSIDFVKQSFISMHKWYRDGFDHSTVKSFFETPLSVIPESYMEKFRRGEPFIIKDVSSMSQNKIKDIFVKINIKTFLGVPLIISGKLIGYTNFAWIKKNNLFSGNELRLLKLFAKMIENITERREEELRHSKELLSKTFTSLNDAVFIINFATGEVIDCNPVAAKIFGYAMEELLGKKTDFLHVDNDALDEFRMHLVSEVKKFGSMRLLEFRMKRKDGTVFPTEHSVTPLFGENREQIGWVSVVRDITERKRIEQEKIFMQEKIIQAGKMTSLGLMVSGVGHEINNPNQVILSNLEYLLKAWKSVLPILNAYYNEKGDFAVGGIKFSEIGKNIDEIIAKAISASEKIKIIVEDLKSFSRKDDYSDAAKIDLNKITKSAVSLMNSMIQSRTDKFSVLYSIEVLMIKANSQRIEQVIVNLIQNACQALKDKSAAVTISTGKSNKELFVRISDQGSGMDEQTLSSLKTPFFTTKREQGGTGLGLFVSDNIIKTYGGRMIIESAKEKGTDVIIYFPEIM